MFKILQKLYIIRLLTPAGMFYLIGAIFAEGINLMTLLDLAAKLHKDSIAVVDEKEEISYEDLYRQSQKLAAALQAEGKLESGQKAALICRNNAALIRALFAVSRLGADIYLLNPEMSAAQFKALCERHHFNYLIYDAEVSEIIEESKLIDKSIVTYHDQLSSIDSLSKAETGQLIPRLKKAYSSNIIVLTGGTTGQPKTAKRKASIFNFLNPFFALLVKLNLDVYKSVYIATPVFHGFGVAAIFIGLVLGKKTFLTSRFEAQKSCALIKQHQIEVVTLVPLMLQRMINCDAPALAPLACIISGGAPLNLALVEESFNKLGDKLFNLYGTSEAGFSLMATPADLRYSSNTIGKKITGVKLKILDAKNTEVTDSAIGRVCIKSRWSVKDDKSDWIETGDLGYQDKNGYYFLCGRSDEMIVSGGENVYPVELENILINHPEIRQVAVIGVPDAEFGQRLKAFVVHTDNSNIDQAAILAWLSGRAARFQMPVRIELSKELPITSIGKINKKLLS